MIWIVLDRKSDISLTKQIYQQIRNSILHGTIKSGEKLPSTRELAATLSVSRNIVLEVYELLIAEGYLIGAPGSGTYVAEGTFLADTPSKRTHTISGDNNISKDNNDLIDFRSGIPALEAFPRKKWSQLEQQIWTDSPVANLSYGPPEGRLELREAICNHLHKYRGVEAEPNQIIVTTGAVQSLSLLTQILLAPDRPYIIEEPIHREIQNIFSFNSSNKYPIPVDEFGLKTDLLPAELKPALVMVTPSHQYPLGVVLPIQRRIELIEYARTSGCYIIEDDYDSEYRYEGPPISSLQGLDPNWVIYIGSFSKVLFPALRLGYMIVPSVLVKICRQYKHLQDNHSQILPQLTLARFIKEGYLEQHIAKMKKIYQKKRDLLISCLRDKFINEIKITGQSTGLHLIVEFVSIKFTTDLLEEIKKTGVKVHPVEEHAFQKGFHSQKIIIGYSHLSPEEIKEGVSRLHSVLGKR